MPRVFIIMGHRKVRKTSTIRALTGVYKFGEWDVTTSDMGVLKIYIHLSALQEKMITPEVFLRDNKNHENILVPLRIDGGYKYPKGIEYIKKIIEAKWVIAGVVVLKEQELVNSGFLDERRLHFLPNSENTPSNQIASKIRNWWNWL